MVCGHKYKHILNVALKFIAFSCIAFGFQNTAFALGLSDIEVYSSLGEPLKADITVLGAEDLTSASCLTLGPDSDIKNINFKLSPINGSTAKIRLKSNNTLNEPIINLSVVAGCDHSIARHYVLLLDPPFITQSKNSKRKAAGTTAVATKAKSTAKQSIAKRSDKKLPSVSKRKAKKKKSSNKNDKKTTKKRNITPNVSTQASPPAATSEAETKAIDNGTNSGKSSSGNPILSISGGSNSLRLPDSAKLRLDKQLILSPSSNLASTIAEDTMIEDELTVVNNRIAHLQKQITSLTQQNLKLTSDNQLAAKQLTQTQSLKIRLRNILLFIFAILLLLLAYIAFSWLRRKQLENQTNSSKALWINTNKKRDKKHISKLKREEDTPKLKPEEDTSKPSKEIKENSAENDLFPPLPLDSKAESIVIEDDQGFSVLDHADVFLFHGRVALAVQLLENYLTDHPKQSATIWLFLLDLLSKEDLKDQYEKTALDCKTHYNIDIPGFSQQTDATESLEDFPRLMQGLCDVWNSPNALVYLNDLIYNDRPAPRSGLPRNLIEELTILKAITLENLNPIDAVQLDKQSLASVQKKKDLLEKEEANKLAVTTKAKKTEDKAALEFTLPDKK